MLNEVMLTTIDNPFDPFEQFVSWQVFDIEKGYNTCALIGRLSNLSNDMTQKEEAEEYERVINSIVANDPRDIYILVKPKNT